MEAIGNNIILASNSQRQIRHNKKAEYNLKFSYYPKQNSVSNIKDAFSWNYSGMRIHGIDSNCVLLGPILIPE